LIPVVFMFRIFRSNYLIIFAFHGNAISLA